VILPKNRSSRRVDGKVQVQGSIVPGFTGSTVRGHRGTFVI
jgi:hypothetical protein